jgi:phenylacetate-coenzyme A ligase PaaK-like adenylate-forming protein
MGDYWNMEFDTMSWDQLHVYWLERLKNLVDYVKVSSPFYAEHLKDVSPRSIESFESVTKLPFMTKHEIRDAQIKGTREFPLGAIQTAKTKNVVQIISSSGTTGRPVYYGITEKDLQSWRDSLANFTYTAGIREEDVVLHIVGIPIFAGGEPYFEGMRHIGAMVVWAGGQTTQKLLEALQNMHCTAVLGTTSFDLYVPTACREILGVEAKELGVKKILGGGEAGLGEEPIRRKIRDAWGCDTVREIMGLADVMPGMWAECEEEMGMHFTAHNNVMVELIDSVTGNHVPWQEGAEGEPIYTTITREATPMVRYASRDHIRVEGTVCRCGRASPRIRCIGRVDDMLIYKAMNVFPSAIRDVIMKDFESCLTGHIQVVKDSAEQVRFDDPIPLDVELKSDVDVEAKKLKKAIEDKVRELLTVRVDVTFVEPGTLQRTQYKTPLVRIRGK